MTSDRRYALRSGSSAPRNDRGCIPKVHAAFQLGAVRPRRASARTTRRKQWMERALAIDPDDPDAQYNAACMWSQLDEPERRRSIARALGDRSSRPETARAGSSTIPTLTRCATTRAMPTLARRQPMAPATARATAASSGTPSRRDPRRRRGRLQPPDGGQRGRHADQPASEHRAELIDPVHRRASGPHRQADRRRHAGRIRQRRQRGRLRGRHPARNARPQRRRCRGPADRVPHRHQPRRRDRRGRRHLRRRRQCRRAARRASPSPAASPCRARCATMSATSSTSTFEDMGEQELKNIGFPVRVYNVVLGDAASDARRGAPNRGQPRPTSRRSRCCRSTT